MFEGLRQIRLFTLALQSHRRFHFGVACRVAFSRVSFDWYAEYQITLWSLKAISKKTRENDENMRVTRQRARPTSRVQLTRRSSLDLTHIRNEEPNGGATSTYRKTIVTNVR
jgi:hypothetical protein